MVYHTKKLTVAVGFEEQFTTLPFPKKQEN
jgi:hypothetical protein